MKRFIYRFIVIIFVCSGLIFFINTSANDPSFSNQSNPLAKSLKNKGVYGNDDRLDYNEANTTAQRASDSVPALIFKNQLELESNGQYYQLKSLPEFATVKTCDDDPFAKQPKIAFCSGFLLDRDKIATAGHCTAKELKPKPEHYEQGESCDNIAVVFDYRVENSGHVNTRISADKVYSCKKVLLREYAKNDKEDYAVLQLDRAVKNRQPLPVNLKGVISDHESVAVIGYPYGLPLKIAGGATVQDNSQYSHFVADLDTFGGNSGSPVLNTTLLLQGQIQVEGLLFNGAPQDFDKIEGDFCEQLHRCKSRDRTDSACSGEGVIRIDRVKQLALRPAPAPPVAKLEISPRQYAVGLGQEIKLDLNLPSDGYLNVIEVNPEGKYTVLYPNKWHPENSQDAGDLTITDANNWKLKVLNGPYGQHRIYASLSQQPINLYTQNSQQLADFVEIDTQQWEKSMRGGGAVSRQSETCENGRGGGAVARESNCQPTVIGWTPICYYAQNPDICQR